MINIYSHLSDAQQWESMHEKVTWWPSKTGDPWNTKHLINDLLKWPGSSRYFRINNVDQNLNAPGQYVMVITNEIAMSDGQPLTCLLPMAKFINSGALDLTIFFVHRALDNIDFDEFRPLLCRRLQLLGISRPECIRVMLGTKYPEFHDDDVLKIKWLYYPWYWGIASDTFNKKSLINIGDIIDPSSKPKRFLSLGGKNLPHRMLMLKSLEQRNLTDHATITVTARSWTWSDLPSNTIKEIDPEFLQWLQNHGDLDHTHYIDTLSSATGINKSPLSLAMLYKDCAWDLVQETYHTLPQGQFLSEKVFRSMIMGVPFVINGCAGSLSLLHELGFRTFDGIIDESYDRIQDDFQRIAAVADQIQTVCEWSEAQMQNHWPQLREIIEHNQQHCQSQDHLAQIHKLLSQ